MEVHEASKIGIQNYIEKLKEQHVAQKAPEPFVDPLREFARASRLAAMARGWLTYPIEERKRLIKSAFIFVPRNTASTNPETEQQFANRMLERWRALNVIIQEESRAEAGNRSAEVAIGALKLLFPEHEWKSPQKA